MTPIDLALAVAGRSSAGLRRRARWAPLSVAAGLVVLSLIPVVVVGSTKQPTEVSLADLQANRLPAATEWFRLEGDLRVAEGHGPNVYILHDLGDDRRAVTVVADAPLPTGHVTVTGHQSGPPIPGTFLSFQADVPTEPVRRDPWPLFSLPAILAVVLLAGLAIGYPVLRRDRPSRSHPIVLRQGESLPARWSGWIGNESVPVDAMRPCTVSVTGDADVCHLTISEAGATRMVSTRRASPKQRLRICRTNGCQPALQVHAPSADLVLTFDEGTERDKLASALE